MGKSIKLPTMAILHTGKNIKYLTILYAWAKHKIPYTVRIEIWAKTLNALQCLYLNMVKNIESFTITVLKYGQKIKCLTMYIFKHEHKR